MRLREGDLVKFNIAYERATGLVGLEIEKEGNAKPVVLPLNESFIVGLMDALSTALQSLRTGKPPVGWEEA